VKCLKGAKLEALGEALFIWIEQVNAKNGKGTDDVTNKRNTWTADGSNKLETQ
jgi:hypothetical protein